MNVEAQEEAVMASLNGGKRRRTRRKRLFRLPQPAIAAASSSTSSSGFSVGATVGEEEEEEDMASCLILLAQGRRRSPDAEIGGGGGGGGSERIVTSHGVAEAPAAADGRKAAGFYVYECKTCSKCFPSFQALGGHRAAHKKPKTAPAALAADERKASHKDVAFARFDPRPRIPPPNDVAVAGVAPMLALFNGGAVGGNKPRVHECSICGSEFSSGQALGGHMRRHRAAAAAAAAIITEAPQGIKRAEKHILSLDLNLPAPPDADGDLAEHPKAASFSFSTKQNLVLSASPLVDCHY